VTWAQAMPLIITVLLAVIGALLAVAVRGGRVLEALRTVQESQKDQGRRMGEMRRDVDVLSTRDVVRRELTGAHRVPVPVGEDQT
jgi:hypothetical protein